MIHKLHNAAQQRALLSKQLHQIQQQKLQQQRPHQSDDLSDCNMDLSDAGETIGPDGKIFATAEEMPITDGKNAGSIRKIITSPKKNATSGEMILTTVDKKIALSDNVNASSNVDKIVANIKDCIVVGKQTVFARNKEIYVHLKM